MLHRPESIASTDMYMALPPSLKFINCTAKHGKRLLADGPWVAEKPMIMAVLRKTCNAPMSKWKLHELKDKESWYRLRNKAEAQEAKRLANGGERDPTAITDVYVHLKTLQDLYSLVRKHSSVNRGGSTFGVLPPRIARGGH